MSASLFAPPRVDRSQEWDCRRLRSLLRPRSERNRADLPLLTVARERGVFVRSAEDANHNTIPEDLSNYKVARRGDLVINKMKSWQGSLGLAPVDGIVSPAYFVFEADIAVPQFGHHLLRSKPYVAKFGAASDGVRVGQWDLNVPRMREIELLLPEAGEQAAIVKYLAHANARIDKAIAAKRRLIALLREQAQATACEVVVRGLDPNAGLRDVALPWVKQIPAHWDYVPVKRLFESMVYGTSENSTGTGPVTALGMGELLNGRVVLARRGGLAAIPHGLDIQEDDLLFNRTNSPALVGKIARVAGDTRDLTFASYLVRCRVATAVDPRWATWLLGSPDFIAFARSQALLSLHQANLSATRYGSLPVVLPSLAEQIEISNFLNEVTADIGNVVAQNEREVALLQEFRTRLVADVVTGQVDVRGISAALPEVDPADLWGGSGLADDADLGELDDAFTDSES
jgi:type I restriction enzyme, S subunit